MIDYKIPNVVLLGILVNLGAGNKTGKIFRIIRKFLLPILFMDLVDGENNIALELKLNSGTLKKLGLGLFDLNDVEVGASFVVNFTLAVENGKISFADIISHTGTCHINQNQSRHSAGLCQPKLLEEKIHADHGKKSRKHSQYKPASHQRFSSPKTHPGERVTHAQDKSRLQDRNDDCYDHRIFIPQEKICPAREQKPVIIQRKLLWNNIIYHSAVFRAVRTKTLHDQSKKGKEPYHTD